MSGAIIAPSMCPLCGTENAGVYVRDARVDDLVCPGCRASCMQQESDELEFPAPASRRIGSPGTLLTTLVRLVRSGATAPLLRVP